MPYVKNLILIYPEDRGTTRYLTVSYLEVYINLLDAKEPKFNLSSENKDEFKSSTKIKTYNKTIINISDDEIKKHKHFLKFELKKNFY